MTLKTPSKTITENEVQLRRIKEFQNNEQDTAMKIFHDCKAQTYQVHFCCFSCKTQIGVVSLLFDNVEGFVYAVKYCKECYQEQNSQNELDKWR